jgi:hypothetical protein
VPITKADVLAVLADPLLATMKFSVDTITVSMEEYNNVAAFISTDDIKVVSGKQTTEAVYDREKNVLEPQAGNSPLSIDQRAQILHECTHAISDVVGFNPLTLVDEVAAYLAQFTYQKISDPPNRDRFPKYKIPAHASPLQVLIIEMLHIVETYNLHNRKGFDAKIGRKDVDHLTHVLQRMRQYRDVRVTLHAASAGVPSFHFVRQIVILVKHNMVRPQ